MTAHLEEKMGAIFEDCTCGARINAQNLPFLSVNIIINSHILISAVLESSNESAAFRDRRLL